MKKILILSLSLNVLGANYMLGTSLLDKARNLKKATTEKVSKSLQSISNKVEDSGIINSIRNSMNLAKTKLTGLAKCNLLKEEDSATSKNLCRFTVCQMGKNLEGPLKQLNKISPDSARKLANACACACKSSGHPKAANALLPYAKLLK